MFRILSTADKKIIQPPKNTVAVKQKAQDFRGTDKKNRGGGEREKMEQPQEKKKKQKKKNRNED